MSGSNRNKLDHSNKPQNGASLSPSSSLPAHPSSTPATANVYLYTQEQCKRKQIQLELLLKDMLETKIHEREFIKNNRDPKTGLYKIEKPAHNRSLTREEKTILFYKESINWLIHFQDILGSGSIFHNHLLSLKSLGRIKKIKTLFSMKEDIKKAAQDYISFHDSTMALKIDTLIQSISTPNSFKQLISELVPFDSDTVVDRIENNSLYLSAHRQKENWKTLLIKSADGLNAAQSIMADLLQHLPEQGRERVALKSTLADLDYMTRKIQVFARSKNEVKNTLTFIWSALPKAITLIRHFPQAFVSVDTVLGERLLEAATQINYILQDIVVAVDQLEIRYLLKENYLLEKSFMGGAEQREPTLAELIASVAGFIPGIEPDKHMADKNKSPEVSKYDSIQESKHASKSDSKESSVNSSHSSDHSPVLSNNDINASLENINLDLIRIHDDVEEIHASNNNLDDAMTPQSIKTMCEKFNSFIEAMGYQFQEKDRYPYTRAILEERERIAAESAQANQHDQEIKDLIKLRRDNASRASIDAENARTELEGKKAAFKQSKKNAIIELIDARILKLQINKSKCCAKKTKLRDKIALLSGLKNELKTRTLDDALDFLANDPRYSVTYHLLWTGDEAKQLKLSKLITAKPEDRVQLIDLEIWKLEKKRSRFSLFNKKLENRINVLREFKNILNHQGTTVAFALNNFNALHRNYYKVLINNESDLLKHLHEIDEHITVVKDGPEVVHGKLANHVNHEHDLLHTHPDLLIGKRLLTATQYNNNKLTHKHLEKKLAAIIQRYQSRGVNEENPQLVSLVQLKHLLIEKEFNLDNALDDLKKEPSAAAASLYDLLESNPATAKILDDLQTMNQKIADTASEGETASQSYRAALDALALLKNTLTSAPDFITTDNALQTIKNTNKKLHLLLKWKAAPLLETLSNLDRDHAKLAGNQKTAAAVTAHITQRNHLIAQEFDRIQQKIMLNIEINKHISTLENECKSGWLSCKPRLFYKTKYNKIALLKNMKERLLTCSLETALSDIARDDTFAATSHLLHTGRTGNIFNSALVSDELTTKIQTEIFRLKTERDKSIMFFGDKRRKDLRSRIETLSSLQNKLSDASCTNVKSALTDQEKKILSTKAAPIWAAIEFMSNAQTARSLER